LVQLVGIRYILGELKVEIRFSYLGAVHLR
jgi:hypothetical protein